MKNPLKVEQEEYTKNIEELKRQGILLIRNRGYNRLSTKKNKKCTYCIKKYINFAKVLGVLMPKCFRTKQ